MQTKEKKSEWPFQFLNKVTGVYGLVAVLIGSGGSAAKLSLCIYSAVALVASEWGLNAVKRVSLGHAESGYVATAYK